MSWLSARQYAPEGGFAGRTNKLVDGCYSHWVGGCWPLLEASISGPQGQDDLTKPAYPGSLFSREGLIRYVLSCCQADEGGLRDKPETWVTPNRKICRCWAISQGIRIHIIHVIRSLVSALCSITTISPKLMGVKKSLPSILLFAGLHRQTHHRSREKSKTGYSTRKTWYCQSIQYTSFPGIMSSKPMTYFPKRRGFKKS